MSHSQGNVSQSKEGGWEEEEGGEEGRYEDKGGDEEKGKMRGEGGGGGRERVRPPRQRLAVCYITTSVPKSYIQVSMVTRP